MRRGYCIRHAVVKNAKHLDKYEEQVLLGVEELW